MSTRNANSESSGPSDDNLPSTMSSQNPSSMHAVKTLAKPSETFASPSDTAVSVSIDDAIDGAETSELSSESTKAATEVLHPASTAQTQSTESPVQIDTAKFDETDRELSNPADSSTQTKPQEASQKTSASEQGAAKAEHAKAAADTITDKNQASTSEESHLSLTASMTKQVEDIAIEPHSAVRKEEILSVSESEAGQTETKDQPSPHANEDNQSANSSDPTVNDLGQEATGISITAKREALADPSSVAAVAHAFGRDSPAPIAQTGEYLNDKPSNKSLPPFSAQESSSVVDTTPALSHRRDDSLAQPSTVSAESASATVVDGSSRGIKIGKGPPPETQASEELPFDFNRFLEQMRHRSAQPVGEYVRSFIKGFAKKPYRTQDQIKLIFDFLDFISARMRECEIWENLSETDFENAKEAMEKLVMNRLYPYTFTPAVQKEGRWAVQSDDLERDRILKQRIGLFVWLKEEHLDIPVGDHSRGFIEFSIQELNKIGHYKAPRDKLICILNCCKVIFGMIRHLSTQESADTFIPVLIFVVLKANPSNLISNVEYISRFRNPDRLSSESGYYLSSLMGAISFIETMDCTSLSNITQEEFEAKVEEAMSTLPPPDSEAQQSRTTLPMSISTPPRSLTPSQAPYHRQRTVSSQSVSSPAGPGDESAKALPFTPIAATLADDTRAFFQRTGEAARTGLSRPMGALGRLFNEGMEGIRTPSNLDSGASTERNSSPVPPAAQESMGMTASTSRSRIFASLFGAADPAEPSGSTRSVSNSLPRSQQLSRGPIGIDDEPPTPSTDGLTQEGFVPYSEGKPSALPNAAARLLRPSVPQRGYSVDDAVFDDELAGRRNLIAAGTGFGRGKGGYPEQDDYDDEDDEDDFHRGDKADDTPNAAALERAKRRQQMQQDFGADSVSDTFPGTPSRRTRATTGGQEAQTYESAQTEEAIQQSLMDQEDLGAVQAETEAQNSAGVETLKSIFPTMDQGVIQMVLLGCEGNVELAIDRLLEMQ